MKISQVQSSASPPSPFEERTVTSEHLLEKIEELVRLMASLSLDVNRAFFTWTQKTSSIKPEQFRNLPAHEQAKYVQIPEPVVIKKPSEPVIGHQTWHKIIKSGIGYHGGHWVSRENPAAVRDIDRFIELLKFHNSLAERFNKLVALRAKVIRDERKQVMSKGSDEQFDMPDKIPSIVVAPGATPFLNPYNMPITSAAVTRHNAFVGPISRYKAPPQLVKILAALRSRLLEHDVDIDIVYAADFSIEIRQKLVRTTNGFQIGTKNVHSMLAIAADNNMFIRHNAPEHFISRFTYFKDADVRSHGGCEVLVPKISKWIWHPCKSNTDVDYLIMVMQRKGIIK